MATYAIGDVQGCYQELRALTAQFKFDPAQDRLWFVGDLVNRGPQSLETLRWIRGLGDAAVAVLGNHDLYCIRLAMGAAGQRKRSDTLQALLEAPDGPLLVDWLRHRPLMHVEKGFVLVHAGLLPAWTVPQAHSLAQEVTAILRGNNYGAFLEHLWGNTPKAWQEELTGWGRLRVIVNAMTRMRFCSVEGQLEFDAKGPPQKAPPGHVPWFALAGRKSRDHTVVFGHWSALGLYREPGLAALDTGCVWGGPLTAMRLEDGAVFQQQANPPVVREAEAGS